MHFMRHFFATAITAVVVGCASLDLPEGKTYQFQEQIGYTSTSVLAVVPWRDLESALVPKFSITPETALERVSAVGAARYSSDVNRSGLDFQVRYLGEIPEQDADNPLAGNIPSVSPGVPQITGGANAPPAQTNLSIPAIERYQLAAALHQEIAMLNAMMRHVATPEGYSPAVVRMRLSITPIVDDAPYTAFIHYSVTPAVGPNVVSGANADIPIAIPLLVANSGAATSIDDSVERMRLLNVAIGAIVQDFAGANLGVQQKIALLNRLQSISFDSRIAVQPATSNSFEVRVAPVMTAAGPRLSHENIEITILLLLPTDEKAETGEKGRAGKVKSEVEIRNEKEYFLTSVTELRHAGNGQPAERGALSDIEKYTRSKEDVTAEERKSDHNFDAILYTQFPGNWKRKNNCEYSELLRAITRAHHASRLTDAFGKCFGIASKNPWNLISEAERVIARVAFSTRFLSDKVTSFHYTEPRYATIVVGDLIVTNENMAISVSANPGSTSGSRGLSADQMKGYLRLRGGSSECPITNQVFIPVQSTSLSSDRLAGTISFGKPPWDPGKLSKCDAEFEHGAAAPAALSVTILEVKAEKPPVQLSVSQQSEVLTASSDGIVSVQISVKNVGTQAVSSLQLSLTDGQFSGADQVSCVPACPGVSVLPSGDVKLTTSLTPGKELLVNLDAENVLESISLQVTSGPASVSKRFFVRSKALVSR